MESSYELISTVLTDHHQINSLKVAAAGYAKWRARLLREERRAIRELWHLRDWTFAYVEADDIVIASGGTDFDLTTPAAGSWLADGVDGGVWTVNGDKRPLVWMRQGRLNMLKQTSNETGPPRFYTVIGNKTLRVWPPPTESTTLFACYKSMAPTPMDDEGGVDDDGLLRIPLDYRESVIYEKVVLKEMEAKGDVQSVAMQAAKIESNIFSMVCNERQGKPWEQNMPRFAGSADVMPDDLLL